MPRCLQYKLKYKLTLKSPAVEKYMNHDPHCDNIDDIFGDLAVTAMLVPLKRVSSERSFRK